MNSAHTIEVLLVEDNPRDAEFILLALRKDGLIRHVEHVRDGQAALDFLFCQGLYAGRESGQPRLVLLDLKLPKVDGIEVLRRLRAQASTAELPVVVFTSSREARDVNALSGLGVNSYVVKPIAFEEFSAAVAMVGRYWVTLNQPLRPTL